MIVDPAANDQKMVEFETSIDSTLISLGIT